MEEAFAVGVRVSLINAAGAGLLGLSKQLLGANAHAKALKAEIASIGKTLAIGGVLTAAGGGLLGLIGKTLPAASEYNSQLQIMNRAGFTQLEIAQATGAAWRNTGTVLTTTATENLRSLTDLRSVLGTMKDAQWALPIVSKVGTVMALSSNGKMDAEAGEQAAFTMAKALDIIGAARDPGTFAREAGMMSKVVTAFQNRVTPGMFQGVFQYARQAKFDLSDEFKYEFLPSMMLEAASSGKSGGGGSRGVGPMLAAIYRVTNQGYLNKQAIPVLNKLGLLTSQAFTKTTTPDTVGAKLQGAALAAQNPFLWEQQVLGPAIRRQLGIGMQDRSDASEQRIRNVINAVFRGNQLAASAMTEFESKPGNYLRDQQLIRGAMPYDKAYQQAVQNDPAFAALALRTQWTNAIIPLGAAILPDFTAGLRALVPMVHEFATWAEKNPAQVKLAMRGLTLVGGALVALGSAAIVGAGIKTVAMAARSLGWLGKLAPAAGAVARIFPMVGVAVEGLAAAAGVSVGALVGTAALITAAVAGVGIAAFAIVKHWDTAKSFWANVRAEGGMFGSWLHGLHDRMTATLSGWSSDVAGWVRRTFHLPPAPPATAPKFNPVAVLHAQNDKDWRAATALLGSYFKAIRDGMAGHVKTWGDFANKLGGAFNRILVKIGAFVKDMATFPIRWAQEHAPKIALPKVTLPHFGQAQPHLAANPPATRGPSRPLFHFPSPAEVQRFLSGASLDVNPKLRAAIGRFGAPETVAKAQAAGRAVGQGVAAGVAGAHPAVRAAAAASGSQAVGGFKMRLGINSPSTVFASLGVDMMRGLVVGIDRAAPLVSARLNGLVQSAMASLRQAQLTIPVLGADGKPTGERMTRTSVPIFGNAPNGGQPVVVHTAVHVDGRKMADVVTRHQAHDASRPHAGTSTFDPTMSAAPVGLGYHP